MAVGGVLVAIQASFEDGRGVSPEEFIAPLNITALDGVGRIVATAEEWDAGLVEFPPVRLSDFPDDEEPDESLLRQLTVALTNVAAFLDRRPTAVFDSICATGMEVRLFIDVWMDQDQMELSIPSTLAAACGRQELSIFVMSNDIAAGEGES